MMVTRPGNGSEPRRRHHSPKSALVWVLSVVAAFGVVGVAAGPARASSTTVTEKNNATFGNILADSASKTLYTLTNNGQPVLCTGVGAQVWPPLTVPPGTKVTGPPGVCCLGTTTNANGDAVTYKGDPVYRYANDSSPSDASGDGVMSFGGTWHVVRVTGAKSAKSVTTTTTPTTTSPAGTSSATSPTTVAASAAAPTTQAAGRTAAATGTPGAGVPSGAPGTGGTPPRRSDAALLIGTASVGLGLGFAFLVLRRRRRET